jgi:hypothetical protein
MDVLDRLAQLEALENESLSQSSSSTTSTTTSSNVSSSSTACHSHISDAHSTTIPFLKRKYLTIAEKEQNKRKLVQKV